MKSKRKLLSMNEEDFKFLMKFKTDEKTYTGILRKVLKNALFLQWIETHEPDIFYQLVRKYKESINQQSQTSSQSSQQVQEPQQSAQPS